MVIRRSGNDAKDFPVFPISTIRFELVLESNPSKLNQIPFKVTITMLWKSSCNNVDSTFF